MVSKGLKRKEVGGGGGGGERKFLSKGYRGTFFIPYYSEEHVPYQIGQDRH